MISVKRDRLLAAGQAIAEKKPSLSALTPEAIVAAARLEAAHFDAEFASMDDYLVELQRRFLAADAIDPGHQLQVEDGALVDVGEQIVAAGIENSTFLRQRQLAGSALQQTHSQS